MQDPTRRQDVTISVGIIGTGDLVFYVANNVTEPNQWAYQWSSADTSSGPRRNVVRSRRS